MRALLTPSHDKALTLLGRRVRTRLQASKSVFIVENVYDWETLGGCCAIASYILHKTLSKLGYETDFVVGEFWKTPRSLVGGFDHCWVRTSQTIIDITAQQFVEELPPVYITDIFDGRYRPLYANKLALSYVNNEWYSDCGIGSCNAVLRIIKDAVLSDEAQLLLGVKARRRDESKASTQSGTRSGKGQSLQGWLHTSR